MEVLQNQQYFFKDLQRKADAQFYIRRPSIANTKQNESEYQQAENKSRNYVRSGQAIYDDPFKFHQKPVNFEYDGRKLQIQETLFKTQAKDYPDVISKYHLKTVGFY